MSSEANIIALHKNGYHYLQNDRRPNRSTYANEYLDKSSFILLPDRHGKPPVYVKHLLEKRTVTDGETSIDLDERVHLCYSYERGKKETAILSNSEKKFLSDLDLLKKRIDTGKLKNIDKINVAIGKLSAKHSRVQRYYDITFD